MEQTSIKIAAWNLLGPGNGQQSPAVATKINDFQETCVGKKSLDIALYIESREGTKTRLPKIDDSKWKKSIRIPNSEKQKSTDDHKDKTKSSVWISARKNDEDKEYPKGILLVSYNQELEIELCCDENGDALPPNENEAQALDQYPGRRTAVGFKVFFQDKTDQELLRVLCIWTTPEPNPATGKISNSQDTYFAVLKNILMHYKENHFFDTDVPCVVLGDTNVNLSSGSDSQEIEKITAKCSDNARKVKELVNDCNLSYPLDLSSEPPSEKPLNTLKHSGLWYRCDHIMVSLDPENQRTFHPKFKSAYLGNFEEEKSDHCPIIFEISVP